MMGLCWRDESYTTVFFSESFLKLFKLTFRINTVNQPHDDVERKITKCQQLLQKFLSSTLEVQHVVY